MDFSSLPRTLQDAITATRHLDIDYIWIDALCIIQDDDEDKKKEIAMMCDIYANLVVTINAATASSVNESFLYPVSKRNFTPPTCEVDMLLGDPASRQYGKVTLAPNHHPYTEDFPIHRRGWTFQEHLLPPRLLVFGYLEPFYLCKKDGGLSLEETCISYNWGTNKPQRFMNNVYHDGGLRSLDKSTADTQFFGLIHQWPGILWQYTRREFGFPADRPHAIKGVIDFICRVLQTTCHFGIFESWPVDCLLWTTSYEKPSAPIAGVPSWSWMAVTGAVGLDLMNASCKSEAVATWDPSRGDHSLLRLKCRILHGQRALDTDPNIQIMANWPDVNDGDEQECYWADRYPTQNAEELFFIRLGTIQHRSSIILIAVQQRQGVYRRCGLVELTHSNVWESVLPVTVAVV